MDRLKDRIDTLMARGWLGRRRASRPRLSNRDESELLRYARNRNLSRRGYDKVFCIGANKTGTTTLEAVLRRTGFRLPCQINQEEELTRVIATGEWCDLKTFCSDYDAFQDLPFSAEQVYIACDALFPNSRFILTIRDEEAWYRSLVAFHKKVFGFDDETRVAPEHFKDQALIRHKNYFYERLKRNVMVMEDGVLRHDWDLLYDKDFRIRRYRARNEQILRYFANRPRDLLVIDVSKEQDTGRIAEFLELDSDMVRPMPRKNATAAI